MLDKIPLATLTFLAGVALLLIAYLNDSVSFDEAWKDLLYLGAACGAIGYVRNGAGKGMRGDTNSDV